MIWLWVTLAVLVILIVLLALGWLFYRGLSFELDDTFEEKDGDEDTDS